LRAASHLAGNHAPALLANVLGVRFGHMSIIPARMADTNLT
jgi:hypothetical protein